MTTVSGLAEIDRKLKEMAKEVDQTLRSQLIAAGKLVEGEAKRLIAQQSTGRTVTRKQPSGNEYEHVASSPGDAPNTDTGKLIQSIQTEIQGDTAYVGTNVVYAKWLEFGTKGKTGETKMEARPFLTPAFYNKLPIINKTMGKEIKLAIYRATKSAV
jgi:HK97 gp10 family phage protein